MFWGFVLEPKKRYNTTVTKPFHISMAALDPKSINDNDISSLVLNVDGTETILCNLGKPNYLQERLDLNFIEGNTITLEVKGKAVVHLSGYFIYEQDGMDDEDDSDLDEEESVDDEEEEADQKALLALRKKINKKSKFNTSTTEDDSDDDDDENMDVSDLAFDDDEDDDDDDGEDDEDDDEDDDDDSEDEEVKIASPGSTPMPPAKKSKGNNAQANINNTTPISAKKKKQLEAQQAKQNNTSGKKNKGDKQAQSPQKQAPLTNGNTTPGSNKKKKNKENNASPNSNAGTPNNNKQAGGDGKTPKKSLEGGVIVEDLKVGQGVPAKSGKMVSVYYAGKLKSNNKQFDATTQGPGFKFRLGKGEVIKGWDVGLNGMKVGGKRRITIPAHMAYGNKGSPPAIPPNSTLVFDVELKNVN